ncbi:hypothetical protein EGW08_010494 [Elysia chlorotica]|uniref:C2H2-type domain-containing protein n=1 Tax=Elysia chlorotica TaxID=188477 RepID=A0A3S0ZSM0_ELYCH|nr:hypothetical protein EGW08_010494 [Elysia chlorotica]
MAQSKGKCCEKKFLYAAETAGFVYLSLDGRSPVCVGFQHRLKLEVSLVSPEGPFQTALSSGRLGLADPDRALAPSLNGSKEESASADSLAAAQWFPGDVEEPLELMSSPEQVDGSISSEMESVPSGVFEVDSKHKLSQEKGNDHPEFNTKWQFLDVRDRKKSLGREVEKFYREHQKTKSKSFSWFSKKKESLVMSKKELDILRDKSHKKSQVVEERCRVQEKNNGFPSSETHGDVDVVTEINLQGASTSNDIQSQEEPVVCICCDKSFPSKKEYERHIKHTPDKYHVCLKCNTAFPFKAYLLVHCMYHDDDEPRSSYKCDRCAFKTPSVSKLKKHMTKHTFEVRFHCCRCTSKRFVSYGALVNHMRQHTHKGHYKCSCCDKLFPSRGALLEHRKTTVPPTCGLCGQVFTNNISRAMHYTKEHSDAILKCSKCGRMYDNKEKLRRHMFLHNRVKHPCPICGVLVNKLERHISRHTAIDDMPDSELFMCDQCPQKFRTETQLKFHQRKHAPYQSKFQCDMCPKACASGSGLTRHIKTVHSDLMPYQCDICGKRCKVKSNLRVHMRIHATSKMFPCNYCDQAFNYKASLQGHLRSKHSLELAAGADFASGGSAMNNAVSPECVSGRDEPSTPEFDLTFLEASSQFVQLSCGDT